MYMKDTLCMKKKNVLCDYVLGVFGRDTRYPGLGLLKLDFFCLGKNKVLKVNKLSDRKIYKMDNITSILVT